MWILQVQRTLQKKNTTVKFENILEVVKTNSARKNTKKNVELTKLDCGQIKFSKENIQKVLKGSKLTNLVDLEVAVPICILIILRRETRRLPMQKK